MTMFVAGLLGIAAPTGLGSVAPVAAVGAPSELIVRLRPGASIAAVNASHGTALVASSSSGAHLVEIIDGRPAEVVLAELALDPAVAHVDPNAEVRSPAVEFSGRIWAWQASTAVAASAQWAPTVLRLGDAHRSATGVGVTVAVVDTGVQLAPVAHPALSGGLIAGYDFVEGDAFPDDSGNRMDDNGNGAIDEAVGHGTHVAGIVRLTAPGARIMPVRVLDSDGTADTWRLVEGMRWAAANGADVINVSAGQYGSSGYLRDTVAELRGQDVVVVAAAGNTGDSRKSFPAAAKCAISVTSSDRLDRLSAFSADGSSVMVAAPGEDVVSAFPGSRYVSWSGTSMATPFVAGEVALLRSAAPGLSFGRTLAAVIGVTARLAGDADVGRIDPARAVNAALTSSIPDPKKSGVESECAG